MIGNLLKKIFGTKSEKDIKALRPIVDEINQIYTGLSTLTDEELRAKTTAFKATIDQAVKSEREEVTALKEKAEKASIHEKDAFFAQIDEIEEGITVQLEEVLKSILPEAFAVVKETARRFKENKSLEVTATALDKELALSRENVQISSDRAKWLNTWDAAGNEILWEMVHYDVQLIGGIVLHEGKIAEMQTGEGKTLVGTLPIYLNALSGRGVHVVTVNNYLARRDALWNAPIFQFHGLTVDCIDNHQPNSEQRRAAYQADITYGTNNEFGFDYLRDNMASQLGDLVQRKHNYAIVDEVDSVLIDDARTPLIISGPTPKGDQHEFNEYKPKVEKLMRAQKQVATNFLADAKRLLAITEEQAPDKKTYNSNQKDGGLALLRAHRGLPKNKVLIKFLSEPGIKSILQKTENFSLQDNGKEMPKVDEALYFTIEEKNNSIELTEMGIDLITGNTDDPTFYIVPDIGSHIAEIDAKGLSTEEAVKAKDGLMRDYSVKVDRIHTMNQLLKAYALFEKDVEYVVMDNKVKIVDEQTGRIMDGRRYSDGLHQAIEAKEDVKIEAATQTYATITLQNYFRMYNKLSGMTGTAETEAQELYQIYKLDVVIIPTNRPIAREDEQDLVYKTNREKYNAIIDEVQKLVEARRPVLVGTTSVESSELLSKMLKARKVPHNVLNAKLHEKEADVVAGAGVSGAVTIATNMAGRGTDIKLREGVKEAGGLAIVGTERHESRRVDRQLRGRAGRQGDPGSSQFFVSLEDNLMRLFGSERIARMMDRMGHEEGEMIQHSLITRSIERAQKKVEENNYGIRKRLLEYDDVMNSQREVIYKKRKNALQEERLSLDISDALYDTSLAICTEFIDHKDYEGFKMELISTLSITSPISEEDFGKANIESLTDQVFKEAYKHYETKKKLVAQMVFNAVKDVIKNNPELSTNLPPIGFTDGNKVIGFRFNRDKLMDSDGMHICTQLEKIITLNFIDDAWKEHLRELDDLKQYIQGGAQYEQKDPLVTYKIESFALFEQMIGKVNKEIISFLQKANLYSQQPGRQEVKETNAGSLKNIQTSRNDVAAVRNNQEQARNQQQGEKPKQQPVVAEEKAGRNDPCPCGSGKKFKNCHV